jgi:WD40 repeat protein
MKIWKKCAGVILLICLAGCATPTPIITPTAVEPPRPQPTSTLPPALPAAVPAPERKTQIKPEIKPTPATFEGPLDAQVSARLGKGLYGALALSPDGKTLAVASTAGIYLFEPDTLKQKGVISDRYPAEVLAWSPDGKQLAAGSLKDTRVTLWEMQNRLLIKTLTAGPVFDLGWSADSENLLVGKHGNTVEVWNVLAGRHRLTLNRQTGTSVSNILDGSLSWSASGAVAFVRPDEGLMVLDGKSGANLFNYKLAAPISRPTRVKWSPDGRWLAVAELAPENVWLLDGQNGQVQMVFKTEVGGVTALAWSIDARYLAVGGHSAGVEIWNVQNKEAVRALENVTGLVNGLTWLNIDHLAVSSENGELLAVWDAFLGEQASAQRGTGPVSHLAWSLDSKILASVQGEHIYQWDSVQRKNLAEVTICPPACVGQLRRFDYRVGVGEWSLLTHETTPRWFLYGKEGLSQPPLPGLKLSGDLVWSRDGLLAAVLQQAPDFSGVILWEQGTGEIHRLALDPGEINLSGILAWSPDKKWLAIEGVQNIILWNLGTNRPLRLKKDNALLTSLVWSPDTQWVAAGTVSGQVWVWEARKALQVQRLDMGARVSGLTWAASEGRLAASSNGLEKMGKVWVWDIRSGRTLKTLENLPQINDLSYSPDGSLLAAGAEDGTIWLLTP